MRERLGKQGSRSLLRHDERGVGLLEVVLALAILAMSITYFARTFGSAESVARQSQARLIGAQIASQTIQEIEHIGYSSVAEGIDCTIGSQHACGETDPNGHLQYGLGSTSCWYYGTTTRYVVPVLGEVPQSTPTQLVPLVPYVSVAPGSPTYSVYPDPVENGVTYTVAAYPMFDTQQYSAMTCTNYERGAVSTIPVTVVVEVTWKSVTTQSTTMQTVLFQQPPIVTPQFTTPTQCTIGAPKSGAHYESNLAFQSGSGSLAPTTTSVTPGGTVQVFFIDEKPDYSTPPQWCAYDEFGNILSIPVTLTVDWLGNKPTHPFVGNITAVDGYGGSGPGANADTPPKAGTYCGTAYTTPGTFVISTTSPIAQAKCTAFEILLTAKVPSYVTDNGVHASILSLTLETWDNEGDGDSYTWTMN